MLSLPKSHYRDIAHELVSSLYAHYDATSPPLFLFNRHGLLHGLRDANISLDEMNCARIYVLLDQIAFTTTRGIRSVAIDEEFETRLNAYSKCVRSGLEQAVLRIPKKLNTT